MKGELTFLMPSAELTEGEAGLGRFLASPKTAQGNAESQTRQPDKSDFTAAGWDLLGVQSRPAQCSGEPMID